MSFDMIEFDSHVVFLYFVDCSECEVEIVGEGDGRIHGSILDPAPHSFDQGFVVTVIVHDGNWCCWLFC